jgi:hypothetical protein
MTSLHPGEREHVIHPDKDWTKQWAWAIFIRVLSNPDQPTSNFGCNLQILVKDLPARLRDKEICWNTVNWNSKYDIVECKREISQKESFWMRYLAFSTPEPLEEKPLHSRSWVAEVAVKHKDVEWLKNHDFRTTPSPKNIEMYAQPRCFSIHSLIQIWQRRNRPADGTGTMQKGCHVSPRNPVWKRHDGTEG